MTLSCPDCRTPYAATDVDLSRGLARCLRCDRVHLIGGAPPAAIRPVVARPANVTEVPDGLAWRWFTPAAFFLAFFCVAWDSFLVFWYISVLSRGGGPEMLPFLLFPLLHVAAGIGLTVYTAALFVNRTALTLRDGSLQISHHPIPWRGARTLSTAGLSQFYVVQRVHRNKNTTSTSYDLMVLDAQDTATHLLRGLSTLEQARYLEQWLEQALGIRNRPVEGEAD